MPNGKMHKKPPKRLSNYKKACKFEEGKEFAKLKAVDRWKKSKKGFMREIYDHLGKAIDRIDPIDAVAIVGTTIIVKNLIDKSEDLRGKVAYLYSKERIEETTHFFLHLFGGVPIPRPGEKSAYEGMFPDWMDWLISFSIAYIIVKHGGELLGLMKAGAGSLTTVVGALLGVVA